MKMLNFAKRNFKEIARDPLSIIFALLLPLVLLVVFDQFEIPNEVYLLENFTPGIVIFSFSFISMFTASLVAKDRCSSLLIRLGVSPMRGSDYVLGYALSVLPLVAVQNLLFFGCALAMGLRFSIGVIFASLASVPISLLFVALGILVGSVTNEKSSAGLSSVVVQLVAFTGGMYFDSSMMGGFFNTLCNILPFSSALEIVKGILNNKTGNMAVPCVKLFLYTAVVSVLAIWVFGKNKGSAK